MQVRTESARKTITADELLSNGPAILCSGVSLNFPLFKETGIWSLTFGGIQAARSTPILRDISFSVPKGRCVGILGRNGAGKTSLLKTIGGVYQPTVGTICCKGSVTRLFDLGVFGARRITGREYAGQYLSLQGKDNVVPSDMIQDICSFSELTEKFDEPLFTYSNGMLARLYFSAATAVSADVYLIDEFLMVGDEYFQEKCWRRLRERMESGAAAVLVTHDWTTVLKLCEEAHLMNQGRIVKSGASDEVVREYLNLEERWHREIAEFSEAMPQQYRARSREDAELIFPVRLHQDTPVVFSYSIEVLQPGRKWGILLLNEDLPVANAKGKYNLCLRIPNFPISPGRYLLNVFLKAPQVDSSERKPVACDGRGWTYGNPLILEVEGAATDCVAAVMINWCHEAVPA